MKFKGEIDNFKTVKKGMKITYFIPLEEMQQVMSEIHKYHNQPLFLGMMIDKQEATELKDRITEEQRKKVYALLKEIGEEIGLNLEDAKETLKYDFLKKCEHDDFSLSDCSKTIAKDFIEYLIQFAIEMGLNLKYEPYRYIDDIEKYINVCLENKVCVICGKKQSDVHHRDAIGMGRNRNKVDDTEYKKISLCREHHTEIHQIGENNFFKKYHLEV